MFGNTDDPDANMAKIRELALKEVDRTRTIAESLICEELRGPEWNARWDVLRVLLASPLQDARLRQVFLAYSHQCGERAQGVLATACLICDVDI